MQRKHTSTFRSFALSTFGLLALTACSGGSGGGGGATGPLFPGQLFAVGEFPVATAIGDVNDDCALDLVAANQDFFTVTVSLNLR